MFWFVNRFHLFYNMSTYLFTMRHTNYKIPTQKQRLLGLLRISIVVLVLATLSVISAYVGKLEISSPKIEFPFHKWETRNIDFPRTMYIILERHISQISDTQCFSRHKARGVVTHVCPFGAAPSKQHTSDIHRRSRLFAGGGAGKTLLLPATVLPS